MKALVVGAGKLGYRLAAALLDEDCEVTVVDNNEDVIENFLRENKNFKIKKLRGKEVLKLFPSVDGSDGFSICLLEKN